MLLLNFANTAGATSRLGRSSGNITWVNAGMKAPEIFLNLISYATSFLRKKFCNCSEWHSRFYRSHPHRTVSADKRIFMVLLRIRSKGDQPHYVSNCRFRPRKYSAEGGFGIEIGCAFFVTFFAQAKKVSTVCYERLREPFLPRPELFLPFVLSAGGTFAPSSLASDRPIAIACLGLVTFFPLLPLFNSPCFISCIALSTLSWAFFPYLAINNFFKNDQYNQRFKMLAIRERQLWVKSYELWVRSQEVGV